MLSRSNRRSGYPGRNPQRARRGLITAVITALAMVAGGAAMACSDAVTAPPASSAIAAANELRALGPLTAANVGAYHNAFLDFSFPRVREAFRKRADHQQLCRAVAQAMRDFILAYRLDADPTTVGDNIAGARCASTGRKGPAYSLGTDGMPSPEFDAVINEMAYAVEIGLAPSELSPLFEQKVAYARANLDSAEADVVAAAASVGLSSVEYWNANYETQLEALRAEMNVEAYALIPISASGDLAPREALLVPESPRFSWKLGAARVGLADLKGAVHGGISGIRGGWQGVLAGALIEGGGKSAGALIAELIK